MSNENEIPTMKTAHHFKQIFLPHFRKAFAEALKEVGLELKGPKDAETRYAVKGAIRAVMEIVADAGWGWSYAAHDAGSAVSNVFGYRSKAAQAANTHFATAGCAEGDEVEEPPQDEDEDEEIDDEEEAPEDN